MVKMSEVRGQRGNRSPRISESYSICQGRALAVTDFVVTLSVWLWRRGWRVVTPLSCLVYAVLSAGMAAAQVVNPTTLAATPRPAMGRGVSVGVQPKEDGLTQPPANADKMFLTVRGVKVDGTFPELEEQTAALVGEIQNQRVSLVRIYEFAAAIQMAYLKAGYPLARVAIPRQNFQNGAVRIVVTDGFLEDIDVSAVPERARNLVRARVEPLLGKRHLTQAELQRRVLLIGDIAGVVGKSATKPGLSTGGRILVIEATEKLLSTATAVTNELPKQLSTWDFIQAVEVNNATGWGEQFYVNARSSRDFDRFFDGTSRFMSYGGGVIVPVGSDGIRMNAGYVLVRQRPTHTWGTFPIAEELAGQGLAGKYEQAYVKAIYPLILTSEQTVRVQATYNYTTNVFRTGPAPLGFALPVGYVYDFYRDRYNAARFSVDWTRQFPWAWGGNVTAAAIYSHGLGGRWGWDSPLFLVGSPLSRPGASSEFNKLYVEAAISQPLPEGFQASLITRAQTSFGAPLMLPEQLSLSGATAISGFASGTLNVDRGVTVRSELSRPFNVDLWITQNAVAAPYVFGAWGGGVREWPYISELKRIEAESLGGGLRANTAITGLPFQESLNLEFAKDFSNIPFQRSGYRTNFSFVVRY